MSGKDYYNYLGVRIGTETVSDASDLLEKATSDMSKLRDCKLAPWQKLDALKTFMYSPTLLEQQLKTFITYPKKVLPTNTYTCQSAKVDWE